MKRNLLKYVTVIGMGGVMVSLLIGGIDPKTSFPDPIKVNGQTIEFTWTDDNADEDLIIYTDQATYSNGVAHAEVYVAVENRSGRDQNIELMGYFRDSKQRISDISVLTEVTTEEPVYATRQECKDITIKATTTKKTDITQNVCTDYQDRVSTTTVTNAVWRPLATLARTDLEKNLEATKLIEKTRKPVEGFIAEKKSSLFTVPASGVVYYKVMVEFPASTDDNFYFEAIGDQGGYGHLDPWFSSSWNYRVKIEVNPTKVGTTTSVTSFPVYVDLAGMPASFWTNAKSDGADVRVVESDDTTETAFEIVYFATTTSQGELHFMADALATTSTSTFYIYYGNSGASAYASTTTYGAQNVWTRYSAVYHFQESSGSRFDSASSTQTMTNSSVAASTTSKIYTGSDFEHTSSAVLTRSDSNTYDFGEDFSITGWFNTESIPSSGTLKGLIAKDDLATQRSWSTDLYNNAGSQKVRMFASGNSTGTQYDEFTWTRTLTTNTWFHLGFTYDISNSRATRGVMWENAVSQGSGSAVNAGASFSAIYTGTALTAIGNYSNPAFTGYYDGVMDEVRFSRDVFPLAWITTEYNNQSSPSSFIWFGAQEANTPAGTTPVEDSAWFN